MKLQAMSACIVCLLCLAACYRITTTPEAKELKSAQNGSSALVGLSNPLKLAMPRATHAAVLLNDGRVLIVGGFEETSAGREIPIASVEIFDPHTEEFTLAGAMQAARSGATATLLNDGKVLIVGGWGIGGRLASAEIFDPKSHTFRLLNSLNSPRASHTATHLNDGRVLIVGGDSARRQLNLNIEVFDPNTQKFTVLGQLRQGRAAHTATLLASGEVLIAGGGDLADSILRTAELIDPLTGSIKRVAPMQVVRHKQSAQRLADGNVLIVGGSDHRDWGGKHATAEIYDTQKQQFRSLLKLEAERFKLSDAVVVLQDGTVLIAGGNRQVQRFDPNGNEFESVGAFETAYYYQTVTLLQDGRALIVGGYDDRIQPVQKAWIYNS